MVKNSYKFALLCLLAVGLCAPWCGAQQTAPTPAGVVTIAQNAALGNGRVSEGTTVFSGDLLKTGDQGRLNVQSGTVQFAIGANSSVRVFHNENRVIVEIEGGTLAYTAGGRSSARSQLNWYDRAGKLVGAAGNPDAYFEIRLSPDERRIAYPRARTDLGWDIWLLDLSTGIASRFTSASGVDPVWSPDSRQVAFWREEPTGRTFMSKPSARTTRS